MDWWYLGGGEEKTLDAAINAILRLSMVLNRRVLVGMGWRDGGGKERTLPRRELVLPWSAHHNHIEYDVTWEGHGTDNCTREGKVVDVPYFGPFPPVRCPQDRKNVGEPSEF